MQFLHRIENKIIIGLMSLLILPSFLGGACNAADDLLRQMFSPSYEGGTSIKGGENFDRVGQNILGGSTKVGADGEGVYIKSSPSVVVKITRLLLSLVIALSVTMILYNGMQYIIQTGQGKEAKDLTKNIAYIVVGILVALFSVVIITLIQSIPKTLDSPELLKENDNKTDNKILEGEGTQKSWGEVKDDIKKIF